MYCSIQNDHTGDYITSFHLAVNNLVKNKGAKNSDVTLGLCNSVKFCAAKTNPAAQEVISPELKCYLERTQIKDFTAVKAIGGDRSFTVVLTHKQTKWRKRNKQQDSKVLNATAAKTHPHSLLLLLCFPLFHPLFSLFIYFFLPFSSLCLLSSLPSVLFISLPHSFLLFHFLHPFSTVFHLFYTFLSFFYLSSIFLCVRHLSLFISIHLLSSLPVHPPPPLTGHYSFSRCEM